jgi:hypothetical protein
MSTLSIQPTYPIFTEADGRPLEDGYIWIGAANLDPQVNPIAIYWDAGLTQPAVQPIRTLNGYPSNNGTPARLYVNSDYSIRVMDKKGGVVYSAPASTERYSEIVISSIDANNVLFTQAGSGAMPRTLQSKLEEWVSVTDFGADPTGVADSTQAILDAQAAGDNIYFPRGTYLVSGNNVFEIDVKTQSWRGEGAVINATSVTGYVARVFSSATYLERATQSFNKTAIYGISLKGTNSAGKFGVLLGKPGGLYDSSNDIVFERVGFDGFEKQFVGDENGWRVKFKECGFNFGGFPIYYAQPANAGEVMEFDHCLLADFTQGIYVDTGDFVFNGCSFFGGAISPFVLLNNAKADFYGCNFENQPNPVAGFTMFRLEDVARVRIFGGKFQINPQTYGFTRPLFYMDPGAQLLLSGVALPLYGTGLDYELNAPVNEQIRSLVQGRNKHVTAIGCDTLSGVLSTFNNQAILGGSNMIVNGGGEAASAAGWTVAPYGTPGSTFIASALYPRNQAHCLLATGVAGGGVVAYQDFNVAGANGRACCVGLWVRAISGVGTVAAPQLQFFDQANNQITPAWSVFGPAVNGADTTYTWYAGNTYIPDGAVKARVIVDAQQLAGGCSVAYDDISFQII